MRKRQRECGNCYWSGQCDSDVRCEFYTPDVQDLSEDDLGELIESRRAKFRAEWDEYLSYNEYYQ